MLSLHFKLLSYYLQHKRFSHERSSCHKITWQAKQGRRCNHATWSLIDLWAAVQWLKPSSTRLAKLSCGILVTCTNHLSWDVSVRKISESTFKALRILQLRTLSRNVTPWTLRKKLFSAACTRDSTLSVITRIRDHRWRSGQMSI